MSVASPSSIRTENEFKTPFRISVLVFVLLAVSLLHVLGLPLASFVLFLAAAGFLWIAVCRPFEGIASFLAFMPIFPMAAMIAQFFGPPYMALATGFSRAVLLLLAVGLWRQNGIKLTTPDWFLLTCFALAAIRLALGGQLIALLSDFNFMLAYGVGRVTSLTAKQEIRWSSRAVWIMAILSVVGMFEIFAIGPGPRTLLYVSVLEGATEGGELNATFHADQFEGIREAATMIGPGGFASLCMVALVIWWVYRRNWLPAAMIAAGLLCSVTRSAWVGTALAIPLVAVRMQQGKRFFLYAALGLVLFAAFVPILGLGDFLSLTRKGQDLSAQGHQESLLLGVEYALDHPFGVGPGNAGSYAMKDNSIGVYFENTYLNFAAEYGIVTCLCFVGFLLTSFLVVWREPSNLGYVAVGIMAGFGFVMAVAPQVEVFPLACWIWFPVGLAVRSSAVPSRSLAGLS
jgi:hypothetical protein